MKRTIALLAGCLIAATLGTLSPVAAQATSTERTTVHLVSRQVATTASAAEDAVNWARAQLGQSAYEGLCLSFVVNAYRNGAGVDIGSAPAAVDYWNARPGQQHPNDGAAPLGALVFWDATSANPYGHVGISLGDGTVISSYEHSDHTIHVFAIADRNGAGYPYLGCLQVA
ncbi:CHAP domain-containing protein [Amycolatopsis sp. NPDC024027]|uniref:CHAP domain-containing protein n=1 Tax=Amycolatopsis sp. NPDC024027 TaxID=3154327 RepID=UPI0033D8CDA2